MNTIGFGTTVLEWANTSGRRDGIATYTQSLLTAIQQQRTDVRPVNLDRSKYLPFKLQSLMSVATGITYSQQKLGEDIALFHATDHMIPLLKDIPVVATIMDAIPLIHPEWVNSSQRKLKNWVFKTTAKRADHVICISEFAADAVAQAFQIHPDNISVIPLGVEIEHYAEQPERERAAVLAKFGLTQPFFIAIGTLQPRKNIDRLVDAFLQLSEDTQLAHPLVIAGQNGWKSEALLSRIQDKCYQNRIYYLDYITQQEKSALLRSALALVHPSLYEGFGLPLLEAFASECPVISSNVTSIPEVAGDAALLIDPYSTAEIHSALLTLIQDNSTRQTLISKGWERAQQFSWHNTASKTSAVYDGLI